jgi:DNA-binding NarL/FixJ family response regulator
MSSIDVSVTGRRRVAVAVVDPLPVVRAGLALLIDAQPDAEVVAQAGEADEALRAISRVRRTRLVVLVGLALEGEHDGPWLIRELRERHPSLSILAIGANADPMTISRSLFVGADGYVDKNADPVSFLAAIQRAGEGEMVLVGPPTESVGMIADGIERGADLDARLTTRERQVLVVAAEGLTARQIASRLGVRERTVTTHLARIYSKLGVGSRLAAVRVAARSGLVSVGAPE